jgi:hypothetical protein
MGTVAERAAAQDQTKAKHHYVTRAYLANMLAPGETRLWVYERNSPRAFRNIPANLASMRAYYTIIHQNGKEDDRFEKLLANDIEGPGIAVIDKLLGGNKQLRLEEIVRGAILIAMQELRVPNMRHQFLTMVKAMGDSFYQSIMSRPGFMEASFAELQDAGKISTSVTAEELRNVYERNGIEIVPANSADLWALSLALKSLSEVYSIMRWTVLVSPRPIFITSDAPVCRSYPQTAGLPAGLANPDLTIYFPVSAHRVLLLQHDHRRHELSQRLIRSGRRREAERLWNRAPSIGYKSISVEDAENINKLIIERAMRWVYSPVEQPSVPALFRGQARNIRVEVGPPGPEGELRTTFRL